MGQRLKNGQTIFFIYTCTKMSSKKNLFGVRNIIFHAPQVNNKWKINFRKNMKSNIPSGKSSICFQLKLCSYLNLKLTFQKRCTLRLYIFHSGFLFEKDFVVWEVILLITPAKVIQEVFIEIKYSKIVILILSKLLKSL